MNKKAFVLAACTVLIWSSGFPGIRASLLGGYTPEHLILFRFLIASGLFLLYSLLPNVHFQLPKKKDLVRIVLLGLIGITTYHVGVTFGSETVNAGTASMIIGAAPIFTTIISFFVLKENMNAVKWIGLGIGFLGICLVAYGSGGGSFGLSRGLVYVVIAVIATSVFFVFQKPLLARYGAIELTAYFTWAGTLPMLFFFPGLIENMQQATWESHAAAIYVGVFPAALAYAAWAVALSMGDAGALSSMLYLEPPLTILIAWVWLHEWPHTISLIGGFIAIASLVFVHFLEKRRLRHLLKAQ